MKCIILQSASVFFLEYIVQLKTKTKRFIVFNITFLILVSFALFVLYPYDLSIFKLRLLLFVIYVIRSYIIYRIGFVERLKL